MPSLGRFIAALDRRRIGFPSNSIGTRRVSIKLTK